MKRMIISLFYRIYNGIKEYCAKMWTKKLRRRLKNSDFTLITNNCIGGIIYHDLGCRFDSPTINLFIKTDDYLSFVKNIEFYSKCELRDVTKNFECNYPVGELVSNDSEKPSINIHFQHYETFEVAEKTWKKRFTRVHYDNMFFIMEFYDDIYDVELLYEFDRLPYQKMALTHRFFEGVTDIISFDFYRGKQDIGKILKYKGISGKRYLDDWDYVAWLNQKSFTYKDYQR